MSERASDCICAIILLVVSGVMLQQLEGVPIEGVLFPQTILYLLIGACVLLLARAVIRKGKTNVQFFAGISPVRWVLGTLIFLTQVYVAMFVSFYTGMGLGMFAMLCLLCPVRNARNLCINMGVSVLFLLFFYVFFARVMHIMFPETLFA